MMTILSQIQKAKKNNQLICICINSINWNNRIIGYVKKIYDTTKFELAVVDEFGQNKNKKTVLLSSVKSLEIGGIYNDNLERLNKNGFVKKQTNQKYYYAKKNNFYQDLSELKTLKTFCTLFFKTEFSIGIITKVTKQEICIKNISYEGIYDGISVFDLKSLTKVRTGSDFENRIAFIKKLKL